MSLQDLYNNFYQLLYGPNFLFIPPLELLDFLQCVQIRSLQHLEELFCQLNLHRTPFQDALPSDGKARMLKRSRFLERRR